MMDEMKVIDIASEYPTIEEIRYCKMNANTESWYNANHNDIVQQEEARQDCIKAQLLTLLEAVPDKAKQAAALVDQLTNPDFQVECIMSDMAFVDGFRAGARMIMEVLK